jgi:hypothetical protein
MKSSNLFLVRTCFSPRLIATVTTLLFALTIMVTTASAQLTGVKSIPGNYADLASAITDLNTQGVGAGGVTFNLAAGNPQTAPLGGYVIGGVGSAVLASASAANPIVFNGGGNTITAPTPQASGALNDGIFKLIGADWVTLNNFMMFENAANTTTAAATNNMTEWGVALLYVTSTDGAQNDTIQNCTMDLDRTYQNTFGIYSNSTHTATAVTASATATGAAGSNDNLKVYSNNITDVNQGIVVVGPTAAADQNNNLDIGGVAVGTANTITNWGTTTTFSGYANVSATSVNGILVRNTRNYNISFNTVTSSVGGVTGTGTLNAIQVPSSSVAPTGTLTQTINNNHLSVQGGNVANVLDGINIPSTSVNATTTISMSNNDFNTFGHTVAGATGAMTFIIETGNPLSTSINANTFTNISANTTGTITFFSFAQSLISGASLSISSNQILTGFTRTGVGTTTVWSTNASSVTGSSHAINNNNFSNITLTGASAFNGILDTDGASATSGPLKSVNGNTFNNINTGAGTVAPLSVNFSGPNSSVSNNTISNITTTNSITCMTLGTSNEATLNVAGNAINTIISGGAVVNGISAGAPTATYSKNKIYDLSGTAAGSVVSGLAVVNTTAASSVTVSNNLVGNLTAPAATGANAVIGINVSGSATTATFNVFYNTVYVSNTTSGAGFGSSGISALASATGTTSVLNLRNNIIVNTSVQNGAGLTVAYRRSTGTAGTLANFSNSSNNNLLYAGTPGASNLIYTDGTSTAQTIFAYRNGIFTAGTISPRESFSVSELPPFLSTTGANANFLHLNPGTPTQAESGGAPIAGITDDFDGNARNGSTPDIGADEFAGILLDLTAPLITYTQLGNGSASATRTFSNVTITDLSGINIAPGTRPRVYYKKSTDTNDLVATGWKFVQANGGGGSPFTFTIDYSLLNAGSVSNGDTIQYFVVAQDLASTPNVGINSGTFNAQPSSVALTGAAFPIGPTINSYNIAGTITGTKTVCAVGCDYKTLTGAAPDGVFDAINNSVVTGNLTISIQEDLTESGTTALNQTSEEGVGGYTITVVSSGASLKTISGAVANGMIRLNGADRVTFDGRVGGVGQFLRFRNTNTSNPTFTLQNDSTNNTIESCLVESANTSLTSGTIVFGTSTGTLGNSGNTIHNCDLRDRSDAAGVPANAVYSSGTTGAPNGANTISACNVFNWTNGGVLVAAAGAGDGWTVNPSNFYQTAARTTTMIAISIQGGSGHSILNNSIGGTAAGAGGANMSINLPFRGIDLTVGTASPTSVQGNVIKNIRSTNPAADFVGSYGIFVESGTVNVGNISGNQVGSSNVAERFESNGDCYGIRVVSATTANVSNNTVNNMTTAAGVPLGEFYFGMSVEGIGGSHTVVNNTITNITNTSTPGGGFDSQTIGLIISASGVQTVRGNTISNVGDSSTLAPPALNNRVFGMIISGTGVGTVVDRNKLDNIYAASAGVGARTDVITCFQAQTVANATYTNNMISTSAGGASDRAIFGMLDLAAAPAISNWYFNSVSITGTATAANNTYAFNRNTTSTTQLRDNIFSDTRSGGTGLHVAMANTNASAAGWPNTASDYNLLFNATPANLTQWLGAAAGNNLTLAGFQAASGGDANTLNADPIFTSASDLHIQIASPAVGTAITFGSVTTDFDNDPRPASNPDRGADEIVQAVGGSIPAGTYYNAAANGGDSLSGNVTVTNQLTLNGILNTGANTLTLGCTATITGASPTSYVNGNLQKAYCATGVKGFEVGTANGYSPVSVTITAGTFPANFTVKAVQGSQPNVNAATSLQRYWSLTGTGVTANLNFNYLDPTDIAGSEAAYRLIRVSGGIPVSFLNDCPTPAANKACVDTAGNQASINGVTSFSDWTVGQPAAPTAGPISLSGIVTRNDGLPLGGVTVNLTGSINGRTITDGNGQYRFVVPDGFYTVAPALANYTFSPASRSFSLVGNKTDAVFTATANSSQTENPVNIGDFFVRQQYLDFLGREPDMAGWLFWSNQIAACGPDQHCAQQKRLDVSAAFFMSDEFQQSGNYIYRLYRAALGRQLTYAEFTDDHTKVVGGADLETMRAQFVEEFIQRPEFVNRYQNAIMAETFVDALLQGMLADTQVDLSSQREALIATYNSGGDQNNSRRAVLQAVADNSAFKTVTYNPSFVLMEYFGYLQRDLDRDGFNFWVNVLNNRDAGNYRGMVCSFITSTEYQERFSPVVTRNDGECGR